MRTFLLLSIVGNLILFSYIVYVRTRPQPVFNQEAYQQSRTSLLESIPTDTGSIYFVGNSLVSEYPVSEIFKGKIENWGVSGSETKNTLTRIDDIVSRKPKKVFIWDGINDIKNGVPFDSTIARFKRMVSELSGTDFYIISVLPIAPPYDNGLIVNINRLNDSLKNYGKYIDLYPHFLNNGQLNSKYTYDGLHLNDEGYKLATSLIKGYLN